MLNIKQMVQGSITSIDEAQIGILRTGKDVIFVRHALLHEIVKVRILKRIQKGYVAEVVEIIKPSIERRKSPCPIFHRCGSCQLLHMQYEAQANHKRKYVERLCVTSKLKVKVQPLLSMQDPYHYRNKMIVGFKKDRSNKVETGFYEEYSHTIIPYKKCLLHPEICDDIVDTIVQLITKFRIEVYDEDKRRGFLRHVLLRYGTMSKQIMVVLVLNQTVFPARKNFIGTLLKKHPQITTVIQNINTRKTSVVLGNQERVLYGKGYIEDVLCNLRFRISASSFYQINHKQTEVLYKTGIELLQLKGTEKVLDAYCGIGTIGMYASTYAKQVIGVERNKDAIADANINAAMNGIKNIRFVCDDASNFLQKLAINKEFIDVVIMDPPRSGSDEVFIKNVVNVKPKKILYISCNVQTQLRDIALFLRNGYTIGDMMPVDLFPHTVHVECVCLITRKDK